MQDTRCMHVLAFLTQTNTKKYGIRGQSVAQLRTLSIYTSRSYDQGFHNALNVVSFLQKNTEYITTSGPFVPALTNSPHVSYTTRVTHMQFPTYSHIHYHPLQRWHPNVRRWMGSAAYVIITYSLPVHSPYGTSKGRRVPRVMVMANRMIGLHLVTLPYEMAVIPITRQEIRTPY